MQGTTNAPRLHKTRNKINQMPQPYNTGIHLLSTANNSQPGPLQNNQKYKNNIGKINEASILQYHRTSNLQLKNINQEVKRFQNRRHQQPIFFKTIHHQNHQNINLKQERNSLEKKLNKDQENVFDKCLSNTTQISKSPELSCKDKLDSKIEQVNVKLYKSNFRNDNNKQNSTSRKIHLYSQNIEGERNFSNNGDEKSTNSDVGNEESQQKLNESNVGSNNEEEHLIENEQNIEEKNQELNLNNANGNVHVKDINERTEKSSREKTPMCLINDLARFNKISFQYRLTSENGPAHCKRFTVTLKLGDEEYTAEGFKIKKAQHLAAKEAIEKTKYKHPIPKTSRSDDANVVKSNITPTVELNALAMKLGQQTYYIFDSNQTDFFDRTAQNDNLKTNYKMTSQFFEATRITQQPTSMSDNQSSTLVSNLVNNNKKIPPLNQKQYFSKCQNHCFPFRHSISTYLSTASPCKITLIVGTRKFEGIGRTLQQAKHNAASNALQVLKQQIHSENNDETHNESTGDNDNKSPISLVFEIGIKRNLPVDFKVLREEGPAHMRTFITACIVGDIMTEGEGTGKKISKKRAAQKMLEELNKLPPIVPIASPIKKVKLKTASKKFGNSQNKAFNLVESKEETEQWIKNKKNNCETESSNPITKLLEWHQNRKEKEPVFKLISECGKENSRRRQFVMEVSSNNIVARGVGHNKKLAKRDAAQNFLTALNGREQIPFISSNDKSNGVSPIQGMSCKENNKCITNSDKLPSVNGSDEGEKFLIMERVNSSETLANVSPFLNESEILIELKSQNVTGINKIQKMVDGFLKETGLIIVTFASTNLPSDLAIGYEKVRVRPYIPLPMKCKNCLQYGHIAKICKNEKNCANCSNGFHINPEKDEKCCNAPSCINCKISNVEDINHSTNDKTCLKEKEIQAIITLEKVGKKKATALYIQRHSQQSTLYSAVTKNSTKQASTSSIMPPPIEVNKPRFIKDYSDLASDIDKSLSEMETDHLSTSSQTITYNKPIILPKNASKRLKDKIKAATRKSKRNK